MFRRFVAAVLVAVSWVVTPSLVLPIPPATAADPVVESAVSFADVPASSQFFREISWLAASGVSTGWDVGGGVREYRPLSGIARDAMAAFLYRQAGSPAFDPPAVSPFVDVPTTAAFYKEITWLASKGITTGWDMGAGRREYRPLAPIARDAMAAFMYRHAGSPAFAPPGASPFADVVVSSQFYKEITWLASAGISTGWDVGNGAREYRPLNSIARDAMAAFLYRYASQKVPANAQDPAAGTVAVAPDVEILGPAQLDAAQISGDTMSLPSDKASSIHPNDVVVSGSTQGTPDGLLVRVLQVTRDPSGTTVVKTRPAALTEAVVSTPGLLEVTGTPVRSSFVPEADVTVNPSPQVRPALPSRQAGPMATVQTSADVFSQSFTWKKTFKTELGYQGLTGSGSVETESAVTASAKAKMTLETGFLGLKETSVVITPSIAAKHSLTIGGKLAGTASATLGELKAWFTFMIGPVPVAVTAEAAVTAKIDLEGEATVSYATSQTITSEHGFTYRDGTFNLVNTKPAVTGVHNDVKATASLKIRPSLNFDVTIKLYGVAGITFGAGPYASAAIAVTTTAGASPTWSCPIEFGHETRIGVVAGIEILGFKYEQSAIDTLTWKLLDVDPCDGTPVTPPSGGSSPLTVTTATLPSGTVGQLYNAALTASGGASPYTWTITAGVLPEGLHLDAATGAIAGTPSTAGTTHLTVRATDKNNAGAAASVTLAVQAPSSPPSGLGNIKSIITGFGTTYALLTDGTVEAWGSNSDGVLGNGTTTDSSIPVRVTGLAGVTALTAIPFGGAEYALLGDGTVRAWGQNANGQLGNGATTSSSTPVQVAGLTGVTTLARGGGAVYALLNDGTVRAWGYNGHGQLGNGTVTDSSTPVQVVGLTGVTALTASGETVYALKTDGTVCAWGYNGHGVLGNGTTIDSRIPVQVVGLTGVTALVTSPYGGTAYALLTDGTVRAWGQNGQGQLGNGTTVDSSTPVQVSGLIGVTALTANPGGGTAYALLSDGTVRAWGYNGHGQLGNGTTATSSTPVQVSDLAGVAVVSANGETAYALLTNGTVRAWGSNQNGQLGNGTTADSSTPVQVIGLANAAAVTTDGGVAYALLTDGTVRAWGNNGYGLGNGTTGGSGTPVQVVGVTSGP